MTRILLVRHGESEWNAAGRWQGQADPPLTERGRLQADQASAAIGTVDAIVSSDLQRARATAEIIAGRLGIEPVVIEPGLRERDAGAFSGLTRSEIHARHPGHLADDPAGQVFDGDGEPLVPPGWESDADLWLRIELVLVALGRLVPDGDVVAVTHGGVIYTVERALGQPGAGRLANLDGRWVSVEADEIRLGDRINLLHPDQTDAIEADRI